MLKRKSDKKDKQQRQGAPIIDAILSTFEFKKTNVRKKPARWRHHISESDETKEENTTKSDVHLFAENDKR